MVQQVQQGPETSPNGRSNGSAGGGVNGGSGPHKSGSGSGGLTFKFPQVGGSGGGGNAGGNQSRGSHSRHEGRTFTDEAQAIPDVHVSIVYNNLFTQFPVLHRSFNEFSFILMLLIQSMNVFLETVIISVNP